jgi:hypothetical protein
MDSLSLAVITGALLLYSLISGRLNGTPITAPVVFIGFGFVVGGGVFDVAHVDVGYSAIHLIAELTLILVLFTDAVLPYRSLMQSTDPQGRLAAGV